MWPFSRASKLAATKQTLDPELIADALVVLKGDGAHFAMLYANMGGYPGRTIEIDTLGQFCGLIEGPPNFTPEGVRFATRALAEDIDLICRSDVFDMSVFGPRNDRNSEYTSLLRTFRAAVQRPGLAQLCESSGFDLAEFIQQTACDRRAADIAKVGAKLEEKRDYLRPILLRARSQGRNKYGDVDYSQYISELEEFLAHYFPQGSLPFFYHIYPVRTATAHVEEWFQEPIDPLTVPVDGHEFEHWCAARIEAQGWTARVTRASGDQGIDVEVMKGDKSIAVQCKRYTSPIGNKCVQEAHSGMVHYNADAAFVIGTGGFTRAAIQLAASTGVILLDAENIGDFTALAEARLGA